jgi:uncharacterized protein YegP (UPF0339 family)
MDASNDPATTQQKILLQKNQAVNEQIDEVEINTTNNLQMIENIIKYIGGTGPNCSKIFELSSIVTELLKNYINDVRFHKLRDPLTELSNSDQNKFELLYADIEGIYTGNIYKSKNTEINKFINSLKQQSESFRTFLIKFAMEDYKRKFDIATDKTKFYTIFLTYFKEKIGVALDTKN